jgi:CDP-diacylglycerol---serine O-phosphatidyltransferase
MTEPDTTKKDIFESTRASRIYVLPNLMTAGNLFCGFVAVIMCIQARSASLLGDDFLAAQFYTRAVWFIMAAVIFDALDGRLARLGGRESLFGKEFDSLADVISFGIAPALMVFFLILSPTQDYPFFRRIGWFIGFLYLLCAAVRLARFNVLTHPAVYSLKQDVYSKDFVGLPVPAAAGTIASLVFVLNAYDLQRWSIILPVLMVLIAYLMVSAIRYPSFKTLDWKTQVRFRTFILVFAAAVLLWQVREIGLALVFLGYITYGIVEHVRREGRRSTRLQEIRRKRLVKNGEKPANKPE